MTIFRSSALLLQISLLALISNSLPAETVMLEPAKDNTIFEEDDLSNGAGIHLFAGKTGTRTIPQTQWRRALLQFNLSGVIPAGSTIESVSLSLHVSRNPTTDSNSRQFGLYLMTADWGEGISNAGNPGGSGAPAATGDATWTHSFYPDANWIFEGGDFNFSASADASVSGIGTYSWSSANMIIDVQGWVDDPSTNFGWALLGPNIDKSARRFDSRENTNVNNRPLLTITYTPGPTHWAGYAILEDGRTVDTGDFLGFIDIEAQPWVYVYSFNSYVYLPESQVTNEGSWTYIPN